MFKSLMKEERSIVFVEDVNKNYIKNDMKYKYYNHITYVWVLVFFLSSCSQKKTADKWRHVEISPIDESQTITVITTKGNKRYFANGKHHKIPKDNYLLLDLSKVDRLGDGFSICWNDSSGYKWKIASTYAELVENKLDTSKYLYYQPLKEDDFPVLVEYKERNCGNILIRENRKPWGDLRIKYITRE